MTQERAERIRQLFADALKLPASERKFFLVRSCGSDKELLAQVESLLSESGSTETTIFGLRVKGSRQPTTAGPSNSGIAGSDDQRLIGVRLKERYLLQSEIGRGGFGVVYLAADEQLLSRPVVVKILLSTNPDLWQRRKFRNEIEALARLNHPGIVSVLDLGETEDGRPFLAMEYVGGTPLRTLMRTDGMDLERAADLIRQIGGALEAAHRSGIWHRDLKPENILVQTMEDGDERIKLIDFGIASVKGSEVQVDSTTRVAGTLRYMAPEQLKGRPSAASDIYGLAVIAYEMVTGRTPFNAETSVELYAMKMAEVQVRPAILRPSLPEEADRSILKALQPAEGNRHPTVRAFAQELFQGLRTAKGAGGFPRKDKEPHCGRLVSRMCDRRSQQDEFRSFLARSAIRDHRLVVFCLVHGDEGECHESLVERFAYDAQLLAQKREGEETSSVKIMKIPWQYEGPIEIRLRRLVAYLFERLGTDPGVRMDDTSPPALASLLASSLASFIFLQHDIRAGRWDSLTKSLIQSYRGYLAKVPRALAGPQIIVCLNVIYPCDPKGERLRVRFDPRALMQRRTKKRIRKALAEIAGPDSRVHGGPTGLCLLLDELRPITRDDVLEWFGLHNILETEDQRLNAATEIFGGMRSMTVSKSMAEIETRLNNLQQSFLLERGFI